MSESKDQVPMSTIARLKSFTGSLVQRREKPASLVFPPPSWELDDTDNSGTGSSAHTPGETKAEEAPIDPPEPITFAKRLRSLIEALPLPSNTFQPSTPHIPQDELQYDITGKEGMQGSPVPPELDESILRMLSSEDVMNGSETPKGKGKGKDKERERESVWSVLAGLGRDVKDRVVPGKVEQRDEAVMMYAPLQPDNDSKLELAESQSILEYVDDQPPNPTHEEPPKPIEKQIWVPSTTQLSVLTTWWGYRLYLPPPIIHTLDATSLKATARAAMITSALKWVLDKLPLTLVPPQFRGAVALLKRLGPVVGYVGVFISWSWNRVRACDKGNGVVLTATWLLPVALIPMAWDAGDIYGPPLAPKDTEIKHEAEPESVPKGPQEQPKEKEEKKSKWRYRW